jgi:virulence-associated protein VagC
MTKVKNQVKTLDLGTRKVSTMNFSKVVTLPKPFTENFLGENMEVQVSMTQEGSLILTPIKKEGK